MIDQINTMRSSFNKQESRGELGLNDASTTGITYDDCRSYHSDCSVGDITETSITDETESKQQLMSTLAMSLVTQQQEISEAFATMVAKMAFMIDEKETENERLQGKFSLESQQRRQEQAEKCTKAVNSLAKKQAKLSRQLEKMVVQLEELNREKDFERVQMKKQMAAMKERIQKIKKSSLDISNSSRGINGPKNRLMMKPQQTTGKAASFRLPKTEHPRLALDHFEIMNHSAGSPTEDYNLPRDHDIPREISFVSTIVDVSEMVTKYVNNDDTTVSSSMDEIQPTGENVRLIL